MKFPSLVSGLPAGKPIRFSGLGIPREPVPDECYIARLGPSTKLPFEERERERINFEAEVLQHIGDPLPVAFYEGKAYGHLYSCLRHEWRGVLRGPLTQGCKVRLLQG